MYLTKLEVKARSRGKVSIHVYSLGPSTIQVSLSLAKLAEVRLLF